MDIEQDLQIKLSWNGAGGNPIANPVVAFSVKKSMVAPVEPAMNRWIANTLDARVVMVKGRCFSIATFLLEYFGCRLIIYVVTFIVLFGSDSNSTHVETCYVSIIIGIF